MFHVHSKRIYILLLLDGMLYSISTKSICYWFSVISSGVLLLVFSSNVLFKASVSLLISCLDDLFIDAGGILKFPTLVVLPAIILCKSVNICLMYLGTLNLGFVCICNCYIFLMYWPLDVNLIPSWSLVTVFVLKSILSDRSIATPFFFWLHLQGLLFPQPFAFSLCVSLGLNWVL